MTEASWPITDMTAGDLAAVHEIDRESPEPWSLTQFREEMTVPEGLQLLCRSRPGGRTAGFLLARFIPDEAEILKLATAREFRQLGVASRLLEFFVAMAETRLIRKIHLELRAANTPARALYAKYAFEMTGRRPNYYTAPNDDAICMTRIMERDQ